MSQWAESFAARVSDYIALSDLTHEVPFELLSTHVIDDEAIFIGRARRGDVHTGVAVHTGPYAELFSGSIDAATGAFVIELREPGWAKGDVPSRAAIAWAAMRFPGIWWMATAPPPLEVLDPPTQR